MKKPFNFGGQNEPRLRLLLQEIGKFKLLSRQEELALSTRILNGDEKAVNLLVKANLRFVVKIAKEYLSYGLSLSDLVIEGTIGLKKAAMKFDALRGVNFISYAVWYVRQAMQLAMMNNSTVKIPINKQQTIRKINRAIRHLEQRLHRDPTAGEIADYLEIDEKIVVDCLSHRQNVISIFEKLYQKRFEDTLPDHDADLKTKQEKKSNLQIILALLNSLPKRQAMITTLYYGLGDDHKRTLDEIAEMMSLSKERVRQLKDIALRELHRRGPKYLANHGIHRSKSGYV